MKVQSKDKRMHDQAIQTSTKEAIEINMSKINIQNYKGLVRRHGS